MKLSTQIKDFTWPAWAALILLLLSISSYQVAQAGYSAQAPTAAVSFDLKNGPHTDLSASGTVFTHLKETLEGQAFKVRVGERVEQDIFRAAARLLEVEGERILAFAFPNESRARLALEQVSADGRTIAGRQVDFRATPRFYSHDRYLLLTVTEDEALLEGFVQALGEPVAGGRSALVRPPGFVIDTGEDVYHALLYEGAEVEVGQNLQAPVDTEEAFSLWVAGEELQLFQMRTRAEAERAAGSISKDGTRIGLFPVPASDTPHFFLAGRVIVFYQGQDRELLDLLVETLGDPVTGNL